MNGWKITVLIILSGTMLFSACSTQNVSNMQLMQGDITSDSLVEETIEDEEYYRVNCSELGYYYWIYDENGDIVKNDGPLSNRPHILMVNKHLVRCTVQAGTGMATQWGYYYDVEKDVISRTFNSIFDQCNDKVIYCDKSTIIVRDIFDKTKYYQEFSGFQEEFSEVAFPYTDVKFVNGAKSIKVSYLSGIDYKEITEIIEIP